MKHKIFFFLAMCLSATMMIAGGSRDIMAATDWQSTGMSQSRLIAATSGTGAEAQVVVGLHIQLSEGWKTYWRMPGDSGLPPQFDWSASRNIKDAEILWPQPSAFDSFGLKSWGYKEEVVLPVRLTLVDPADVVKADLEVFYGICEQVCIPVKERFTLDISPGDGPDDDEAALIAQFVGRIPQTVGGGAPVEKLAAQLAPDGRLIVDAQSTANNHFQMPNLILEGHEGDYFDVKSTSLIDGGKKVRFEVRMDLVKADSVFTGRTFIATILDGKRASEGRVHLKK